MIIILCKILSKNTIYQKLKIAMYLYILFEKNKEKKTKIDEPPFLSYYNML